jgi:hypothetical protein
MARYATAWFLNPADTDAALSVSVLIYDHINDAQPFDQDGTLANRLSGYYIAQSAKDILQSVFLDADPGRRNVQLSDGDLLNIALMHSFLASPSREKEELKRSLKAMRKYREHNGAPNPDLYLSLASEIEGFDGPSAASLYMTAAAQLDQAIRPEEAEKVAEAALTADPKLRSESRLFPVYGGVKRVFAALSERDSASARSIVVQLNAQPVSAVIEPVGPNGLFEALLTEKLPASASGVLQIITGVTLQEIAKTQVLTFGHAGRSTVGGAGIGRPLDGDRFVSGPVSEDVQQVVLKVYGHAGAEDPDSYVQSALGFIDPVNARYFAPLQNQLKLGEVVLPQTTPFHETLSREPAHVDEPSILESYSAFLDLGSLLTTGPSTARSRFAASFSLEFSLKRWVPDAAWPIGGVWKQLRWKHRHHVGWSLRAVEALGNSTIVDSSSPSAKGVSIANQSDIEFGFYAPILGNDLTFSYHDRLFTPFAAPVVMGRLQTEGPHVGEVFPEIGIRLGIFRSPVTLRSIQPEPYFRLDAIYGKGDSYRGFLHSPDTLQPQNQLQIKGESRLFSTPLVAGFEKTLGPWPRDLRVYVAFRLDLISIAKLVRGPSPRQF